MFNSTRTLAAFGTALSTLVLASLGHAQFKYGSGQNSQYWADRIVPTTAQPLVSTTVSRVPHADHASEADHAVEADRATEADHAAEAEHAQNADHASEADHADEADYAYAAEQAHSADEARTLSPDTCAPGEILMKAGSDWQCAPMPSSAGSVLLGRAYAPAEVGTPVFAGPNDPLDLFQSLEIVEMVLPRDGLLRNLVLTPAYPPRDALNIVTTVTVLVNGTPTDLSVTHDALADGGSAGMNREAAIPVQAGDMIAFELRDAGSPCIDPDATPYGACAVGWYKFAVSLD